jgi:hypothetical protein
VLARPAPDRRRFACVAKLTKLKFPKKLGDSSEALRLAGLRSMPGKVSRFIERLEQSSMCFVAATSIWTDSGIRPIEEIREGDTVLAPAEFNREQSFNPSLRRLRCVRRRWEHFFQRCLSMGPQSIEQS